MTGGDPLQGRGVIFEFISNGDMVRVAAIDPVTGTEVYVFGPVNTRQKDLERIAARKLARRLGLLTTQDNPDTKTPRPGNGRGVIV